MSATADPGLLDRQRELAAIGEALETVRRGRGSVLAYAGPVGIGKTSLLQVVNREGRAAGCRVAAARGAEVERDLPFGIIRQLLEPALARRNGSRRAGLLDEAAALAGPAFGLPAPAGPAAADSTFAVCHGLYWLTSNLASERALVLVVDDLHWADEPSARWLAYLARRLDGLPVLVAVGVRLGDAPMPPDVGDILDDAATTLVRPAPLSPAATAEMVCAVLGTELSPEFAAAVHRACGGNPFYLRELLVALAERGVPATDAAAVAEIGPQRIARTVLRRVSDLGRSATDLVAAVAVLGECAPVAHAAAVAGLSMEEVTPAVDALGQAGIFEAGPQLSFAHPVVRSAIYAHMPVYRRSTGHARAARVLSAAGADPAQVAAQLMLTIPAGDPSTATALLAAAQDATTRGAPEIAVRLLDRALAEPPARLQAAPTIRALGIAHAQCGDLTAATRQLRRALDAIDDPVERPQTARELARVLLADGQAAEAVRVLAEAIETLADHQSDLGLQLEGELARAGQFTHEARAIALAHSCRFRPDGDAPTRAFLAQAAMETVMRGTADEAALLARRALDHGNFLAAEGAESQVFYMAANALALAGELQDAISGYGEALAVAAEHGSLRGLCLASCYRSLSFYWSGALADAEADGRLALERGADRLGTVAPLAVAGVVASLTDQGRLGAARAVLDEHHFGARMREPLFFNHLAAAAARLAAAEGQPEQAVAWLRDCGEREQAWHVETPAIVPWRAQLAPLLAADGKRNEARNLADEELRRCRRFGAPGQLAMALHAVSVTGPERSALERLEEAAALLERSPMRLQRARVLVALGSVLRRSGRRTDARAPLRAALDEARRCAATPLAEQAHGELLASGVHVRKILRAGAEELTPGERRVAQLAAKGQSNREIAQALFLSVRTVETHLRHAYRKLDLTSREGLSQALAS